MKNIVKLIISILICQLAGVAGSFFTTPAIKTWHAFLIKPSFNPPNWVFAPVWIVLFLLMGISLYLVWSKNWHVEVKAGEAEQKTWNPISRKLFSGSWREENAVLIFSLQLVLNILWTIIFFGLKMPGVAFFEILMLWFAILYTIINFHRISKVAGFLLLPYILWVTFAAVLNYSVWQLNLSQSDNAVTQKEQACILSSGTIGTSLCCKSAEDFPNTSLIGACGCSSDNSHEVKVCNCGPDRVFDGTECVSQLTFCQPKQREGDVCFQLYDPVCAKVNIQCVTTPCDPINETFSNPCEACRNSLVESYTRGECAN